MTQQSAVTVEHVVKSYGSFRAVDDLTFQVKHGETFAMLGPNGAGKSTTIRMILDIMRPDTGKIHVLGAPINDATKNRLGYLPEERGLYRNAKTIEMMTYLGTLKGLNNREAHKRSMSMLEQLDLAEHADKKITELSKGMQQKVQFAVTVLHEPELIIVDEPFSGLDPVNTLIIKDLIQNMRENGAAVIMSTHQMHQVEEMADRLLMIHRGKQALYGPVDQVRRDYALHAVVVEGEGDFSHLRGVTRIERSPRNRDALILHLEDDVSANDMLGTIAADSQIEVSRFELAVPSLNDIFIRVAGERITQTGEVEQIQLNNNREPVA